MNIREVWERASVKYGVVGGAAIILAVAILFLAGVIEWDFVMGLVNGG